MNKYCMGCGVLLQNVDKRKEGYVPDLEKNICQRCFRLTNYHEMNLNEKTIDFSKIINTVNQSQGFCFFLTDILNLTTDAFNYYNQIKRPKVLVISRSDLIPKSLSHHRIKNYLAIEKGITDVYFLSVKKNKGLQKIKDLLDNQPNLIYILGMTNVGKSSLINELFQSQNTVSEMPNTTVDFIKVDDKVYDAAGFNYNFSLPEVLIKKMRNIPTLKPIVMPLKAQAGLLIPDLMRLEVEHDANLTLFVPLSLNCRKIYHNEEIYLNEQTAHLKIPSGSNLVLKGFGFIYFKKSCDIIIYQIDQKMLEIKPSFYRSEYYE